MGGLHYNASLVYVDGRPGDGWKTASGRKAMLSLLEEQSRYLELGRLSPSATSPPYHGPSLLDELSLRILLPRAHSFRREFRMAALETILGARADSESREVD